MIGYKNSQQKPVVGQPRTVIAVSILRNAASYPCKLLHHNTLSKCGSMTVDVQFVGPRLKEDACSYGQCTMQPYVAETYPLVALCLRPWRIIPVAMGTLNESTPSTIPMRRRFVHRD